MSRFFRHGFTIVEVMVVTVIMVILLGLTVVNMAGQQTVARDNERKVKSENLARGMERYYTSVAKPSVGTIGRYPDRATALSDIATVLPGITATDFTFSFNNDASNFVVANDPTGTTPAEDAAAIASINSLATTNSIVYVPKTWSTTNNRWEMCGTDEPCTRFSLYYRTEDNQLHEIKSRMQQ